MEGYLVDQLLQNYIHYTAFHIFSETAVLNIGENKTAVLTGYWFNTLILDWLTVKIYLSFRKK